MIVQIINITASQSEWNKYNQQYVNLIISKQSKFYSPSKSKTVEKKFQILLLITSQKSSRLKKLLLIAGTAFF